MMKETSVDWSPGFVRKQKYTCAKLFVCFLLIGLSFLLFFNHSAGFFFVLETAVDTHKEEHPDGLKGGEPRKDIPYAAKSDGIEMSVPEMAIDVEDGIPPKGQCDLFDGEWISNPSGPAYTNESCLMIENHQNCMKNGRPDTGYLYWRWKPQGCDLPTFDAKRFLDAMRNKSWAFIGDSISRNHVQSLLCLLSKEQEAEEVYHDKEFRSKTWHFSSYNFTLSMIWSPFLIKAEIFEDMNGVSHKDIRLHLDTLDYKWTSEFNKYDYILTAGGKWFLKTAIYFENDTAVGCHNCPEKNITELGIEYAYRKALGLVFHHYMSSGYEGTVLFRTSAPDHFEYGEWWNGGICNRTVPFKGGEVSMKDVDKFMRNIELEEFKKAVAIRSKKGARLKLLDTTFLSLLRPDGHPGPYRQFHPFGKDKNAKVQNDCLHWCLPGPIDSWNDIVAEMVLRG